MLRTYVSPLLEFDEENTDLRHAKLDEADLRGADLRKTEGLTTQMVELAIIDKETRLPTRLSSARKEDCEEATS